MAVLVLMLMIIGGGVIMRLVSSMIMAMMSVGMIILAVVMRMAGPVVLGMRRIGAALRREGCFDVAQATTELGEHGFNDVIAADAQGSGEDFDGQMPVAEMPGDPRELLRVARADFDQGFGGRDDFDEPAIVELQGVAVAQNGRVGQIEQKRDAVRRLEGDAAAMACVEIEHDRVGRAIGECAAWLQARCAQHGVSEGRRWGRYCPGRDLITRAGRYDILRAPQSRRSAGS